MYMLLQCLSLYTAVRTSIVCEEEATAHLCSLWGLSVLHAVLFKLYLEKDRYTVFEDDRVVMIRVLASRPAPKLTPVTIMLSDDSAVSECPISAPSHVR